MLKENEIEHMHARLSYAVRVNIDVTTSVSNMYKCVLAHTHSICMCMYYLVKCSRYLFFFCGDSSWLFIEELKEKVTTKGWRDEIILVVILQELGNLRKYINTFLYL